MKIANFFFLCFFAATSAILSAQQPTQSGKPSKLESTLLLFGKKTVRTNDRPFNKTHLIPKLEILGFFQKRIAMELEFPVNHKTSFILHASRRSMNQSEPNRAPGTYTSSYTISNVESVNWFLFIPIVSHKTHTNQSQDGNWGDFLPTATFAVEPKIRTYLGKKKSCNRFYLEPGAKISFLTGVTKSDRISQLDSKTTHIGGYPSSSTTTTSTYVRKSTVTGGKKRVVAGVSLGFGCQVEAGQRIVFDLGIDMKASATNGYSGLKKVSLLPLVQVGYRI